MQTGEPWSSPNHSRTTWGEINLVWDGFGRTPVGVALHFSQAASLILGSICCRLVKNWLSRESWWSTWRLRLLTIILWPLHTIWQGCVHIWMFCICQVILWLKASSYSHGPCKRANCSTCTTREMTAGSWWSLLGFGFSLCTCRGLSRAGLSMAVQLSSCNSENWSFLSFIFAACAPIWLDLTSSGCFFSFQVMTTFK